MCTFNYFCNEVVISFGDMMWLFFCALLFGVLCCCCCCCFYFVFFNKFRRQKAKPISAKMNTIKEKYANFIEWRRNPSGAKHRHVKETRIDHNQGQPTGPTKPRTTPTRPTKDNPQAT